MQLNRLQWKHQFVNPNGIISVCLCAAVLFGGQIAVADDADKPKTDEAKPTADKPAADADQPVEEKNPFTRHFRVKDFDGGNGWLNTSGPITPQDLRGKIVILDFWTYCCINCIHILPELKALEKKYPDQLVVIGIHSAKFDNEKGTENIRQAIMRYEIEHPVINDSDMTLWRKFFTRSWPTIGIIDPEGYFVGNNSGEFQHQTIDKHVIQPLLAYHRKKGTLDETPIDFQLERESAQPTPLRYPGKLLADEAADRLYISDSNNNRIVITTLDGKLVDIIGNGNMGIDDGGYDTATFDHPQGMALRGDVLYIADTENHLIRKVDLKTKQVATLAGTGEQNRSRRVGKELLTTALNSPWALSAIGDQLYIAMAGPHQMWVLDETAGTVRPYAGSGREDVIDGPMFESAMAQPSGVATDGEFLYVVDSEASAVRKIDLDPEGNVTTLVGENGGGLFRFGDVDGVGAEVKLQHPLGITYDNGKLYVADSYNHKIKVVDIDTRECTTFLGTGTAGNKAQPPQFSEPAGLAVAGSRLYIADTNNHQIRVADLDSKQVTTLDIAGLMPPSPPKAVAKQRPLKNVIKLPPTEIAAGKTLPFAVQLDIPDGFKINKLAPVTYRVTAQGAQSLIADKHLGVRGEAKFADGAAQFTLPLEQETGATTLLISVTYQFCRDGAGGLCKIRTANWSLPITVNPTATERIVKLTVPAPEK
ncbi:Thiol-disulfide oxidoreductase YkuV [Symmachiella dynata]|uniref:thioredoxin-like domain-containing protein n=1 Tax=Symmachiella dynata TaxID=2527995 RepID=UPI00118B1EF2|nr:thioredoxin-like domain-containing protein [Symmachiella dynata]QDT48790.1 Thiol-disulfide oxidoreductase YkuV [Symmachiella dynata]